MLENEGFAFEKYVDIFDGGPTMTARTDAVRSIAAARPARVIAIDRDGGAESLVATGRLADFRCAYARVREVGADAVIDAAAAGVLKLREDDAILHIPRV